MNVAESGSRKRRSTTRGARTWAGDAVEVVVAAAAVAIEVATAEADAVETDPAEEADAAAVAVVAAERISKAVISPRTSKVASRCTRAAEPAPVAAVSSKPMAEGSAGAAATIVVKDVAVAVEAAGWVAAEAGAGAVAVTAAAVDAAEAVRLLRSSSS